MEAVVCFDTVSKAVIPDGSLDVVVLDFSKVAQIHYEVLERVSILVEKVEAMEDDPGVPV